MSFHVCILPSLLIAAFLAVAGGDRGDPGVSTVTSAAEADRLRPRREADLREALRLVPRAGQAEERVAARPQGRAPAATRRSCPGKSADSLLFQLVTGQDKDRPMPPKGAADRGRDRDAARRGSIRGRSGRTTARTPPTPTDWWWFKPLKKPAVARQARIPIDHFIRAKLRDRGLSPSPEADRRTLIRRLYFDLIGLPPTPEEVEAFVADKSPDAYEKLVDRLLASPHYGERWARHWLDVVHYGETHGYDKDKPRPNAWPYRDYVIRSLNADKPYAPVRAGAGRRRRALPRHGGRHRGARLPRGRAVGLHRPRRVARDEDRRQDRPAPRPRRHGRQHRSARS